MEVALRLVAGGAQRPYGPVRVAVQAVQRDQAARLRLIDQDGAAGELEGADSVQHPGAQRQAGRCAARDPEAAEARAVALEQLHPLASLRRVGDDETTIRGQVERAGGDDTPRLGSDLHQRLRRVAVRRDAIDRMPPPVEDVGVSVIGLLIDGRLAERADDVRRQTAGGAEALDLLRADRCPAEQRDGDRQAELQGLSQ